MSGSALRIVPRLVALQNNSFPASLRLVRGSSLRFSLLKERPGPATTNQYFHGKYFHGSATRGISQAARDKVILMRSRRSVEDRVQIVICEQLNVHADKVNNQTSFVAFGADSLDKVELLMALEDEFGMSIPDSDAENITNGQTAIDYINEHLA